MNRTCRIEGCTFGSDGAAYTVSPEATTAPQVVAEMNLHLQMDHFAPRQLAGFSQEQKLKPPLRNLLPKIECRSVKNIDMIL